MDNVSNRHNLANPSPPEHAGQTPDQDSPTEELPAARGSGVPAVVALGRMATAVPVAADKAPVPTGLPTAVAPAVRSGLPAAHNGPPLPPQGADDDRVAKGSPVNDHDHIDDPEHEVVMLPPGAAGGGGQNNPPKPPGSGPEDDPPSDPDEEGYIIAVDEYITNAQQATLPASATTTIPSLGGSVEYTKQFFGPGSNVADYTEALFNDQFERIEGTQDVVLREDQSQVIAGGVAAVFTPGNVVLDPSSGEAVQLHQLSRMFPEAVIVGVDSAYSEERQVDLQQPGVHLTHGDRNTLEGIPDRSVDAIISVLGAEAWEDIDETSSGPNFVDAWTRVAAPGAVIRFWAGEGVYRLPSMETVQALLEERDWAVTISGQSAIAVRKSNPEGAEAEKLVGGGAPDEPNQPDEAAQEEAALQADIDAYLAHPIDLEHNQTTIIPTVSGPMPFTNHMGSRTNATATDYMLDLFADQVGPSLEATSAGTMIPIIEFKSDAEPIAGGIQGALGDDKVVVDIGSGQAMPLHHFSRTFPGVYIGLDDGYAETRTLDLQKQGVQLTADSWDLLETLPDGSVDTFLMRHSAFFWGQSPERIVAAMTRAGKPGTVLRVPTRDVRHKRAEIEGALTANGWEVMVGEHTTIAVRKQIEPEPKQPRDDGTRTGSGEEMYARPTGLEARRQVLAEHGLDLRDRTRWEVGFMTNTIPSKAEVLDVGAGDARVWRDAATELPPDWNVTITDRSPGMIEAAQATLRDRSGFTIQSADMLSLPFQNDTFDALTAFQSLTNIPEADLEKAIREAYRVLRQGGALYATAVTTEGLDFFRAPFNMESGEQWLRRVFPHVERYIYPRNPRPLGPEATARFLGSTASAATQPSTGEPTEAQGRLSFRYGLFVARK